MLEEYFCPMCGKMFIPAPQHMYKDKSKWYCSWTCYNHRNDEKKQRKSHAVEQYSKTGALIKTFESAIKAAEHIDGTDDNIRRACKQCTFYRGYLWRYKK